MSTENLRPLQSIIVGTGRAGQARIRAVESLRETALLRTFSIRNDGLKAPQDYLLSGSAELVIICTENDLHAALIKQALLANYHVLVEFPLVNSAKKAKELWRLAEKRNRHLLCECITLLTPSHRIRREILSKQHWQKIEVRFQAGVYRWIESEIQKAHIGQLAIGRLQALWDLTGELSLERVQYSEFADGYQVEIWLKTQNEKQVYLRENRRKENKRSAQWSLDGETFPPNRIPPDQPLFEQDLQLAVQHIRGKKEYYLSSEACLGVLRLAEQISQACQLE